MLQVVVIGAVAAGMSAAAKLKRNMGDGVDIVVYERGGETSYAACGIPYFVGDVVREPDMLIERTPENFAESGIDVKLFHEVTAVDTAAKTVAVRNLKTGEEFERGYDKLVVGTGAAVRKFPPLDQPRENLYQVRTVNDGESLKRHLRNKDVRTVVVVGAGFIGLEIVEACKKQGKHVVLVEFAERVLSVMDPVVTDRLTAELVKHDIDVRVDTKVADVECDGDRIKAVVLETANGTYETIAADLVVNCAGIAPETGFIDVKKAINGAIIVDDQMRTSAPDVYAAGDCSVMTSFLTKEHQYAPLGTNANKQGRIIAEVIAGKPAPRLDLIGCSAIKLFDIDAAKVGLSEIDAQRLNIDHKANTITANSYASYYGPEKVLVKIVYHAKTRKILGAQTVGQGIVVPRANYFAIAIRAGMTVDEFGYQDLCYSPPFSGVWDAALIAANTAK